MSEPLLRIRNHHIPGFGDPPIIDGDDANIYVGYFANEHGEQWIFTRNQTTRRAILRGGDMGWNEEHEVVDGSVGALKLNAHETQWFLACGGAATAFDDVRK